jgi:uncharacterized membrane protein
MSFANPLALLLLLLLPYFVWLGRPRGIWARGRVWAALVLRGLIILLLVLALAGLQIVNRSDKLAVVFLIDGSASMSPQAVETARQYSADVISQLQPDDQAAIVVFGSDALVERPMSGIKDTGPITSKVIPLNTDLAEAIRLGMALYPPGAARRMVILSDGLPNVGDAEAAARLAASSGIQIVAVPYQSLTGTEVMVTNVDAPTRLSEGQTFDLNVTIESTSQTQAAIRVTGVGQVLVEQAISLTPGTNHYTFTLKAGQAGLTSFKVEVVPQGNDTFYENNELSAFTQVVGPPRVLVVADDETEVNNLTAALLAQGFQVDQTTGGGLPADLATLSNYQTVVMGNVPASSLGPSKMRVLQAYVRDLGGGLVVSGGPHAYGVGGYFQTPLEETLPVEMQLKDQQRLPQIAVVYVIDKSGSMADTSVGGFQKVELAKEAIIRSIQLLGPLDKVGVVAFDESGKWVVPLAQLTDRGATAQMVGTIRADGGTDIFAGVETVSKVLPEDPSRLKHIVLLTDGGADETGVPELVQKMYDEKGVTLSVIAIGEGYAPWIEKLPKIADGRFHFAYNVDTIPEIFTEETVIATRAYIIENEFFPTLTGNSPIMTGIGQTPSILGYVGTSIKPAAQQILATDKKDPLLAAWQYGLGRSVAWTSDANGRWSANWASWPDYARFWSQAVRWTITEGANQNVQVQVSQEGDTARIVVDARGDNGEYLNGMDMTASVVSPDLTSSPLTLKQVAPGRYEGTFKPGEEGAYFVRVAGADTDGGGSEAQPAVAQTSGWVLAYSPEFRSFEGNPDYLQFIAGLTGGSVIDNPQAILAHNLPVEQATQPLAAALLLIATLILPFDIAVRRLVITRGDVQRLASWAGVSRRAEPVQSGASRVGSLLGVKQRLPRSQSSGRSGPPIPGPSEPTAPTAPPAGTVSPSQRMRPKSAPSRPAASGGTASSLLKSKRERRGDD